MTQPSLVVDNTIAPVDTNVLTLAPKTLRHTDRGCQVEVQYHSSSHSWHWSVELPPRTVKFDGFAADESSALRAAKCRVDDVSL